MGYDFHITRAEHWIGDTAPITLSEVEAVLGRLPEGFSVHGAGQLAMTNPATGEVISTRVKPHVTFQDGRDEEGRVDIYFDSPHGPKFGLSSLKFMLPIFDLADALNAKIQGDEGEVYHQRDILSD